MIFNLLQNIYNACKRLFASIINSLKTIHSIAASGLYLSIVFLTKTFSEGTIQLLKITFYYPFKFLYHVPGVTLIVDTYIFLADSLVQFLLSFILFNYTEIKRLIELILNGLWFVARNVHTAATRSINLVYNFIVLAPLSFLSYATTMTAQKTALAINHSAKLIEHAFFAIKSLFALLARLLIQQPIILIKKLIAKVLAITNFGLQTGISIFQLAAKNILSIGKNLITLPLKTGNLLLTLTKQGLHLIQKNLFLAINRFIQSIITASSFIVEKIGNTGTNIFNLLKNIILTLGKTSSNTYHNVHNKASTIREQSLTKLNAMQNVTRTALAGTAGFVFFDIPRSIIHKIRTTYELIKRIITNTKNWLSEKTKIVFSKTILQTKRWWRLARTVLAKTTRLLKKLLHGTYASAKSQLLRALGHAQMYLFAFNAQIKNLGQSINRSIISFVITSTIFLKKITTTSINTPSLVFKKSSELLTDRFFAIRSSLQQVGTFIKSVISFFYQTTIKIMTTIFYVLKKTTTWLVRIIVKTTTLATTAGKSGFLLLGKGSKLTGLTIWSTLQKTCFGIASIGTYSKAIATFLYENFRHIINTAMQTFPTIKTNRNTIEKYTLFGSFLYTTLVLLTTYLTPPKMPFFIQKQTYDSQSFSRSLPVSICFELQKIIRSNGTFGAVFMQGILTQSYEAGIESARNLDNITIENAKEFSLKKLGSSINNRNIVATRFLITATLETSASLAPAFPFAHTESCFIIKNNALTSQDIFFVPTATSFSPDFNTALNTKINLNKPSAELITANDNPSLTITLEHSGVPAYILLTLYAIIIGLIFMALSSLSSLIPHTIKLFWSGISIIGLSGLWITGYMFGLLPTVNHLFLTILIGLAISLLSFGFNAKSGYPTDIIDESSKTNWLIGLCLLLATYLTILIGL